MKHPTGPPTITVDLVEWERLRERLVLYDRNLVRACEAQRFIRQSVHQAHHTGPIAGCPASTCIEARRVLGEPT